MIRHVNYDKVIRISLMKSKLREIFLEEVNLLYKKCFKMKKYGSLLIKT